MTMDTYDDLKQFVGSKNNFADDLLNQGYAKGRADAIEEVKHQMISLHTDMIFRYGADIIETKCDAFDELKKWLKEQK